jgi:aminoglycoside phosphotransferase (APT) family kinase protein
MEPMTTGASEHPAALSWARAVPGSAMPPAITPLKPQIKPSHKSGVYRLHGVGPVGADVVAKRCRRATAEVELAVCREILPQLPVSWLRYFDPLDEGPDTGFAWLFMEDAGNATCAPEDLRDVALWLAHLHVGAAELRATGGAPNLRHSGAERYARHLSEARVKLATAVANWETVPQRWNDRALLGEHERLLDRAGRSWQRLCDFATLSPPTLVHGDFVKKNLRMRGGLPATSVFVLDWETAGWGSPAADLASLSSMFADEQTIDAIEAYAAAVRERWPSPDVATFRRMARAGVVFRLLASVDWACDGLKEDWNHRALGQLRVYAPRLERAIDAVEAQ